MNPRSKKSNVSDDSGSIHAAGATRRGKRRCSISPTLHQGLEGRKRYGWIKTPSPRWDEANQENIWHDDVLDPVIRLRFILEGRATADDDERAGG